MEQAELYQDIILDHARHPRNFHAMEAPSQFAHGDNPLCGDNVTVYLRLGGGRIEGISFEGRGCAVSTASASLMTEVLQGKTVPEAEVLLGDFQARVTGGAAVAVPPELAEAAEKLEPLTGVRAFPSRVKCATLAWHAFAAALRGGGETVKTE
jgi:nitrogen fixation NifU-like protein